MGADHEIAYKLDGKEVTSLIFRIATMGLSLSSAVLSAVMKGATSQCVNENGVPIDTVSYKDNSSFVYLIAANTVSAVLQAVAIVLKIRKKDEETKLIKAVIEFLDTVVQALLYSSTGAAFAGHNISPCGRRFAAVCCRPGSSCRQVRLSSRVSLSAAIAISATVITKRVSIAVSVDSSSESTCESSYKHGCHL